MTHHPNTTWLITSRTVQLKDGTTQTFPTHEIVNHQPHGVGVTFQQLGDDDRLGVHNCPDCRITSAVIDNGPGAKKTDQQTKESANG